MKKSIVIIIMLAFVVLAAKAQCSCECCSRTTVPTLSQTFSGSTFVTSGSLLTSSGLPKKPVWREQSILTLEEYFTNKKTKPKDTIIRDFWKDTDTTTLRTVKRKMDAIGFSTIEEGGKLAHYPVNQTDSLSEVVNYIIAYDWKKTIIEVKGKLVKTIEPHLVEDGYRKKRDKTPVKYIYRNKEVIPLEIFYQTKRKPLD